jgi:hypothetical protein
MQVASRRRLRILYLHQHYSRPTGSTATRSFLQARALAEAGHAVARACGRYRGAETGLDAPFRRGRRSGAPDGFEVVEFDIPCANAQSLPARGLGFLRYAAATSRLALGAPWDLVVASSTPLTVALPLSGARVEDHAALLRTDAFPTLTVSYRQLKGDPR